MYWFLSRPDPVSATTPVALVIETDEDSAYTEANDSLQVLLLLHGKRQGSEMDASSSVMASAEAGASLLSLTDIAGRSMQVEDDLGDLDDTQVSELGRKRWKVDSVVKDTLMRCAEDAASSELKAITSKLSQDAADRDPRLAERDGALVEKLTPVKVVSDSMDSKINNLSESVEQN